ncbi:putative cochaperone prefoldin complex subunit [Plasmodium gaboni]|uniref:Putative cochaperone prefoldin complex subunit n=1 Tax=Plasmodium gaboni TaxID=647221 RepID=A0A151LJ82_9APIC|nr:putative cochaperone prefoldin complex subunit [Plasmodium gaboni]KYN98919.1 putative cochaperone prefoldin complex subunit [Plasmodium gaboni]
MVCDIEKFEENKREKPNIVIQLNTLGLDELVSLTLKLEQEWKVIKKNYSILEGAVVTYDKCKSAVEQLNPSKYNTKSFNMFMNELERSDLIKLCNKDKTPEKNINKETEEKSEKENIGDISSSKDIAHINEEKKEDQQEEKEIIKEEEKKTFEVHIPLTSLVYCPCKIVNTDEFMVRMGTNYYVERNSEEVIEYYNNKIKKINEQMSKLKITISEKKNEIDLCKNYIQIKRREQQMNTLNVPQQSKSS